MATQSGWTDGGALSAEREPLTQVASSASLAPNSGNDDPTGLLSRGYCESLRLSKRFPSRTVMVGPVAMGSAHPIRCQTMTTTDTRDVDASVDQVIRCAKAGADLVRLTVQGVKEAEACKFIREKLFIKGYNTPLVADIHFNPKIAMLVADAFEKIRVNPGNFADGLKKWEDKIFDTEDDFVAGRKRIEQLFSPLVEKCKKLKRVIRIGTNHGSLSSRILGYYGDTPKGMVESAFEFADICRQHDFHDFVFSMKAANPLVMVQAYRRLVAEQKLKGWNYPVHLGVTEAGEGEDGRIKSALGIGSLLQDGIGDTIRVSLTEDPWYELAPCKRFADLSSFKQSPEGHSRQAAVPAYTETTRDITSFSRREVKLPCQEAGDVWDVRGVLHRDGSAIAPVRIEDLHKPESLYIALNCQMAVGMPIKAQGSADSIYLSEVPPVTDRQARLTLSRLQDAKMGILAPVEELLKRPVDNAIAVVSLKELHKYVERKEKGETSTGQRVESDNMGEGVMRMVVRVEGDETEEQMELLNNSKPEPLFILFSPPPTLSYLHSGRRIFDWLKRRNSKLPVIHSMNLSDSNVTAEDASLMYAMEMGALLVDGLGDGVMLEGALPVAERTSMAFNILQGARMRSTKTEFISCPSCGRTLFNLQEVTEQIRRRTGHLPGVAIAVMGCIVNGVGEMADADFGYVGGSPGLVDLYVRKTMVQKGIPNEEACDKLIQLIKDHGRWVEPPEEQESSGATASSERVAAE
eukprot:GHVS01089201.1.p1 GENE.GHVS01089201.1~~GHVS01089201.1.p1  ORF type:complete len:837 (-),score=115.60 GHVS01089201.1:418-2661(-)